MTHKTLTILRVTLFTTILYAGDTAQVKQLNKIYVGVTFTPGVSYRLLTKGLAQNASLYDFTDVINEANQNEKMTFGYCVGIKTGFRVRKFMAIETGAEYASVSYIFKRNDLRTEDGYLPNGEYDPTKYGSLKTTHNFHYLKIPLGFNFSIGDGPAQCVINTGLNFDFLIGGSQKSVWHFSNENGSSSNSSTLPGPYNRINVSPFLGIGLDYHINQMLTLRVMPTAQLQMFNNVKSDIARRHWLAGINTCLLFGFKK